MRRPSRSIGTVPPPASDATTWKQHGEITNTLGLEEGTHKEQRGKTERAGSGITAGRVKGQSGFVCGGPGGAQIARPGGRQGGNEDRARRRM